jgi:peptide chain release factor 1
MIRLPDIAPFRRRKEELDAQMADPGFYANPRRAADITREHQRMAELLENEAAWRRLGREIAEHENLVRDPAADRDLRELAAAELPALTARLEELEHRLLAAMVPPDPTDSRNTILELRAGTGGEEAALFAAELFRAYTRFCEARGWQVQTLSASSSERGGFREAVALVTGQDVYRTLKFESGVHRVQRVPATEANGRIHTSTVTVAVLPEAEEVDVHLDPADLEITVSRASGPGGQGVNTSDSAVQVLHKPTGIIVYCAEGRSQQKNKAQALTVLRSRLLQARQEEERARYAENRRAQIGTGDRSERIRTYNFPQSRVTDHRIGLTLHSLAQVMEGAFDPLVAALQEADLAEKLAALSGTAGAAPSAFPRPER